MAVSEAKKRADARWHKKAYDQLLLKIRKDAEINGDYIRAHAAEQGESINGFLVRAIAEAIERDKQKAWCF